MGKYSQDKKIAANDALINAVDTDTKFESLKEVLEMLKSEDATKTFAQLVDARITAALGESGSITTAISGAITAALGENGAITTAISGAITAGIGENGDIETWADGRYAPKSNG